MHENINLPWLIGGDFNEVTNSTEKVGGLPINNRRSDNFLACLNHCQLIDLGYTGGTYTWSNNRHISHRILERLDRCLANYDWLTIFPESSIHYLPRTHSDHSPLLLTLKKYSVPQDKIFHFETMWITHPQFTSLITYN